MKLSVYIPALTCDDLYRRCRRSIDRSIEHARRIGCCLPPGEYEIFTVAGVSPVSEARNEGVRRASGTWIATVDSDDEVEEAWFSEIVRALSRAEDSAVPVDDVVFDMTIVRGEHETVMTYGRAEIVEGRMLRNDLVRDVRMFSHMWRHVLRRNIFVDERFSHATVLEDYLLMPGLLEKVRNALYVAKPLYRYVIRRGSLSDSVDRRKVLGLAIERYCLYGHPAEIGACQFAYDSLYYHEDADGSARRFIRRHLLRALLDGSLGPKMKMKLLLASIGLVIRHPRS